MKNAPQFSFFLTTKDNTILHFKQKTLFSWKNGVSQWERLQTPLFLYFGGYLWFFFTIVYNYLSGHVVILMFWSFCLAWLPLELLVGSRAIFGMVWYGFSNWFWCLWSRPRARACLVWLFKLVLMSVVQVTCKSLFGMAFKNWILWLLSNVYRSRARACLLWLSKTGSDR